VTELSEERVDLDLLHRWLSEEAYWAKGRARDKVEAAVAASWWVAAWDQDVMVGFARMVTDRATHGWLCDVFVAADARGRGIGSELVERALERGREWGLRRVLLATRDAHEVYRRQGFGDVDHGVFMEIYL
jgi:GNAT superfamily N-acetyltransferase